MRLATNGLCIERQDLLVLHTLRVTNGIYIAFPVHGTDLPRRGGLVLVRWLPFVSMAKDNFGERLLILKLQKYGNKSLGYNWK